MKRVNGTTCEYSRAYGTRELELALLVRVTKPGGRTHNGVQTRSNRTTPIQTFYRAGWYRARKPMLALTSVAVSVVTGGYCSYRWCQRGVV